LFFGTPEFASSQLEAIIDAKFDVVAVVTVPDRPAGRGKRLTFSDVKQTALKYNLPLLQPEKLRDENFIESLKSFHANLFVVVAFRMLPEVVWSIPEYGTFNLHASLLPQYRGAAPINHVIINGETQTGNTTFFIDREIDKGKIILQEHTNIGPSETAGELHDKLMKSGNGLIVKTLHLIAEEKENAVPQSELEDGVELKPAPKISKEFCKIDWKKSGQEIYNHIRGLSPYPAAHATIVSEAGNRIEIKVFETELEGSSASDEPFSLLTDGKTYLKVVLPDSTLSLKTIQQAGKKVMPIHDFLIGQRMSGKWFVE